MPTQETIARGGLTGENVGPGDTTVAIVSQPGTSSLDYYARNGSTKLNVYFQPQDPASTGTIQVDFGPRQPLRPGWQLFTFSQALQMDINNRSGGTKYGWAVVQ